MTDASKPSLKDRWHNLSGKGKAGVVIAVIAVLGVVSVATGSGDKKSSKADAEAPACTHSLLTAADPAIVQAAQSVSLPAGAKLMRVQATTDSDDRSKQALIVDICGLSIETADQLRPFATSYAKAMDAAPFGDTVNKMYVSNFTTYTDKDLKGEQKVKVFPFGTINWNATGGLVSVDTYWTACPDGTCPS